MKAINTQLPVLPGGRKPVIVVPDVRDGMISDATGAALPGADFLKVLSRGLDSELKANTIIRLNAERYDIRLS